MADVDPDMQKAFAKAGGAPPMPEADKDHMAKLAAKKREAMAAQVRAHDNAVPSLAPARCPFWARKPPVSHVRSPPSRPRSLPCTADPLCCQAAAAAAAEQGELEEEDSKEDEIPLRPASGKATKDQVRRQLLFPRAACHGSAREHGC